MLDIIYKNICDDEQKNILIEIYKENLYKENLYINAIIMTDNQLYRIVEIKSNDKNIIIKIYRFDKNVFIKLNEFVNFIDDGYIINVQTELPYELEDFSDIKYLNFNINILSFLYSINITEFINNFRGNINKIIFEWQKDFVPGVFLYLFVLNVKPEHLFYVCRILPEIKKIFYKDVKIFYNNFDLLENYKNNVLVNAFKKRQIRTDPIKNCAILKTEFENEFDEDMYLRIKHLI